MVYVPTIIGEIGVLIFNSLILYYLVKYDFHVDQWNKVHNVKRQKILQSSLPIYFCCWVIVSFVAWYHFHFIQLGEFFAISVVTPVIMIALARWALT